ncbi:MAG: hypothetical protein CFH33_00229 [Alphaproteobacteria bacterium MarineAlpha9_Bin3]|nr:MAG: hypothetical protein CFH33_00229 [Alphaproteobacteria bacterium MarineAlpha9_Bin3]|tara:strand:+ start:9110 stop:9352 length:243 start_codon:yes stop_codon:yes gene_type:complete
MKYEVLKRSSFIKINNSQISKITKFEYSIEKINYGKRIQSKYFRSFCNSLFDKIKIKNRANIFYKNSNSYEKYSKDWWLI